jgi:serine/threonine protein phosphatase PrpC
MMAVNGDAFVVKRWSGSALVGVIDGLGHGQYASRAAQAARQYVESHYDQPLDAIFRGVERACHGTRGVVMALARFDYGPHNSQCDRDASEVKLTFASIGNVEARVFPLHPSASSILEDSRTSQVEAKKRQLNFMVRRGVVGLNAPKPLITEHAWDLGNMMVLHTDGITTRWSWNGFHHLASKPASVIAAELLRALAKDDDATVAVVKGVTL